MFTQRGVQIPSDVWRMAAVTLIPLQVQSEIEKLIPISSTQSMAELDRKLEPFSTVNDALQPH